MIAREDLAEIISGYDPSRLTIGTIGSHSALNIFKGAKEEGFRTVCICEEDDAIVYERFPLADEVIIVEDPSEILEEGVQERLRGMNAVLVPHGSFTAYISAERLADELRVPMFGNRHLLRWEVSRVSQEEWLRRAGLRLPRSFKGPEEIDRPIIAKLPGARGGRGYFIANSPESFHRRVGEMIGRGLLEEGDLERIHLQEYVLGVNVYPHYFSSIIRGEVELLGFDKRYESSVDAIGRIPAREQLEADIAPTYTIVGNIPITLRESLLPEFLRMGDAVQRAAKELAPPGIIGPFCLETIVTEDLEIFAFEISARIVAGTNVEIGTSPYAYLKHGEWMYTGRRIALEIKEALREGRLREVLT
jgi:5-formaminoimidazole-4-carboxamide-1-(beta)-D-ribofuranosyl 5'-monophosphate synthetase